MARTFRNTITVFCYPETSLISKRMTAAYIPRNFSKSYRIRVKFKSMRELHSRLFEVPGMDKDACHEYDHDY